MSVSSVLLANHCQRAPFHCSASVFWQRLIMGYNLSQLFLCLMLPLCLIPIFAPFVGFPLPPPFTVCCLSLPPSINFSCVVKCVQFRALLSLCMEKFVQKVDVTVLPLVHVLCNRAKQKWQTHIVSTTVWSGVKLYHLIPHFISYCDIRAFLCAKQ